MGEDGRPHGVVGGGRRARGVKGGEGRDESPVPPTIAMEIGSWNIVSAVSRKREEGSCRYRLLGGRTWRACRAGWCGIRKER